MKRVIATNGLLLGLVLAAILVASQDHEAIGANLASLGWGALLLPLAFLPSVVLSALSWRQLFRSGRAPGLIAALYGKWVAISVNTLMPLAGIGGDMVRIRMLIHARIDGSDAMASVVVEKTVDAITLVLWGLVGMAFLVALGADGELVRGAFVASVLLAIGIAGFVIVQHAGTFGFLARRFGGMRRPKAWAGIIENAVGLDANIRFLYGLPGRIMLSIALRLLSRAAQTFELWLAIALMGQSITPWEAFMLKSLTTTLRGAAFFVPGGWGVQEGGFIVFGGLIGFPPDFMLALALATRIRELLISVPGVLTWQFAEGRRLLKRRVSTRCR